MPDSDKQINDRIVVDTYAWVEYFKGSAEGTKAKKFIEGNFELFTPSIVIAELSDKYRREKIEEWPIRNRFIVLKTQILILNEDIADNAGEVKQELKSKFKHAGLADAIVFAHSIDSDTKILTGDKHLKHLKNSIDITR